MSNLFRKYRKRTSLAALVVLAYFLVQTAVFNPVFCLPTNAGANIEMCVLDFQCPCICDHSHDEDHEAQAAWRNLCKICRDIPISLGNDLMPHSPAHGDIGDASVLLTEPCASTVSFNSIPFPHPKDYRPPGIPLIQLSCILIC